jgi:hypothetical protein
MIDRRLGAPVLFYGISGNANNFVGAAFTLIHR